MNIQYKKSKKIFIISLVAVLLIVGGVIGYLTYAKQASMWPFTSSTQENSQSTSSSSDNDSKDTNTTDTTYGSDKNNTPSNNETKPDTSNNKQSVAVSITSAGIIGDTVEVRAYVEGIIEGGGTCTATLTMDGSAPVTGTSEAFVNATSTQCRPIEIAKSNVKSGKWNVVVEYTSSTSTGKSPAMEVQL